jgi:RNA polymerase sigma factor (sigma-70 family)
MATSISSLVPVVQRISRTIAPTVRSPADREDLFQEGVVGLLEAASRYEGGRGCSLRTFSTKRASGAMLDHLRGLVRRNREAPARDTVDSGAQVQWAAAVRSPESAVVLRRFRAFLRDGWAALPRLEREVLRLRFFEDLPVREAATDLGVSPATIVRAEQRALAMLRAGFQGRRDRGDAGRPAPGTRGAA